MNPPTLAALLESFFRRRLIEQRNASPLTVATYRDGLRLLVQYASRRAKREPCRLDVRDLDRDVVLGFLEHVERERSDWIHAMTAEMVLMSTLRHGAATAADGLAHERGQSKNDQTVAEDAERPADKATVDAVAALERRRGARVAEVAERRAASMRRYGLGAAAR